MKVIDTKEFIMFELFEQIRETVTETTETFFDGL